jgi:hypothetical protein
MPVPHREEGGLEVEAMQWSAERARALCSEAREDERTVLAVDQTALGSEVVGDVDARGGEKHPTQTSQHRRGRVEQ